jgi:hypothetical protein
MKESDVIKFIRILGYQDTDMVLRDNWINITCPLADTRHKSGKDSHPSAGISINPQGNSFFKCFSCTPVPINILNLVIYKSMQTLYSEPALSLFYQKHEIPYHSDEELAEDEIFSPTPIEHAFKFNKWIRSKPEKEEEDLPLKFPDELLSNFPLLAGASDTVAMQIKDYLVNVRKIGMGAISELGVRYNKFKNLIIYPLTDIKGNIQVLRARVCALNTKQMFTISSKQFNNKFKLPSIRDSGASFGLHKINPQNPVIIVESETDCLLLRTYGFNNVIATTSASFSKSQVYSIPSPNLWVGFDSDDAGKRAAKNLIDMSNGKLIHIINWENAGGKDPGDAENRLDIARAISKKVLVDGYSRRSKYKS